MKKLSGIRKRALQAATAAAVLGLVNAALASDTLDFPAGVACTFPLRIDSAGGNQVYREFLDKNGNLVRSISAGTGAALTFTNVDTGATFSTRSNGSVTKIAYHPDGSFTFVTTGHNVLILFPTDMPAGPTTTLYVGRVVFDSDADFNFTLQSHSGTSKDICATLS